MLLLHIYRLTQLNRTCAAARPLSLVSACVDRSPKRVQPYLRIMRVDKPTGTMLLYWPCTWSIAMCSAAGSPPDFRLLGLFGLGAFLMRGAGCIVNDLWDKEFDKKVERTKFRPLPSGTLSTSQAVTLLGGLLSCSLGILLQLNNYCIVLGASSLLLVFTYPLFKRFTYWPQVALGLTFNWGIPLGWAAVCNSIELPAVVILYAGSICWTLIYDTIYAHQDKTDDLIVGVKSTALKFGQQTKPYLLAFGSVMTGCLLGTGAMCDQTWPYYLGVGLTSAHVLWQILSLNIDDPKDCWKKFNSNRYIGLILFFSIVCSNLIKDE